MNRSFWYLPSLLALALGACSKVESVPATQLLVSVSSDFSDIASVEVQLFDEQEQRPGMSSTVPKPPPFTFAVLPAENGPALRNLIVLRARDAAGNLVAVSKAIVAFDLNRLVEVELRFVQPCRGVTACTPAFSCTAESAGQCIGVPVVVGRSRDDFKPGDEHGTIFGMTTSADGGLPDASISGGSLAGGNPSGGNTGGGAPLAGDGAVVVSDAGAVEVPDSSTMPQPMGGAQPDGGDQVDSGPQAECDQSNPCTPGYMCVDAKCSSLCETTQCDLNASCSLMGATPVCTCKAGYVGQKGSDGKVTCLEDRDCAQLACNATSQSCELGSNGVRACVCKPGYTGTTCQPVSCGPLQVANGTVATGTGTFGATATYTCENGYTKSGGTTRRCETNGMWSGSAARCDPRDCGRPPTIQRGTVTVETSTTYPNGQVRYTCNSGFTLSGSATRMCTATGWSGAEPRCLGCGDGVVTGSEECEVGVGGASWADCIKCKSSRGTFQMCGEANNGFGCVSGNYCEPIKSYCTPECTSRDQCPQPPTGSALRVSCQVGQGCEVSGCDSFFSPCPGGLTCSGGICVAALPPI